MHFCHWLLHAGKECPEDDTSKHLDVQSEQHGKAGCYCCCIRNDARLSHQTEGFTGTH